MKMLPSEDKYKNSYRVKGTIYVVERKYLDNEDGCPHPTAKDKIKKYIGSDFSCLTMDENHDSMQVVNTKPEGRKDETI